MHERKHNRKRDKKRGRLRETGSSTIFNIAVLYLLENFRPDGVVTFFVLFQTMWFQVQVLSNTSGCGRHAEGIPDRRRLVEIFESYCSFGRRVGGFVVPRNCRGPCCHTTDSPMQPRPGGFTPGRPWPSYSEFPRLKLSNTYRGTPYLTASSEAIRPHFRL